MARSISVSVMFDVVTVSGPVLLPGIGVLAVFGLARSRINFGRIPRPNVLFLVVLSVGGSGVFGLSISIDGAFDSASESIIIARRSLDGDLTNRPSGPRGPVPLLLYSWLKSMGLLIIFRCITLPLGVVTV